MMRALGLACVFFMFASAGMADQRLPLSLTGQIEQGGLVIGKTQPKSTVTLDGRNLRVSDQGDFVFGFSRDHSPTAVLLVQLPGGKQIEEILNIAKRSWQIERVDGLPPEKVTPPNEIILKRIKDEAALVSAARERDDDRTNFLEGFTWPVLGRISGVYGSQRILNGEPRAVHYGVDIAAPRGTPITAPADGLVTLAYSEMYLSGNTLIIDHGHGVSSTMIHMDTITVHDGQFVQRGDVVGTLGATGRATGPHLDWRINWFETRIDPERLVGPMPASAAK